MKVLVIENKENGKTFEEFLKSDKPILIMHYASWCPHCIMFKPDWNKITDALSSNNDINVVEVELSNADYINKKYTEDVRSYPTIRIIKNNMATEEYNGSRSDWTKIVDFAKAHISQKPAETIKATTPKATTPKATTPKVTTPKAVPTIKIESSKSTKSPKVNPDPTSATPKIEKGITEKIPNLKTQSITAKRLSTPKQIKIINSEPIVEISKIIEQISIQKPVVKPKYQEYNVQK